MILWKDRLINYYKNCRRRTTDNPEINSKKRKRGEGSFSTLPDENSNKQKRPCLAWGVKNYLPPIPNGEDEITLQCHLAKLKKESMLVKDKQNQKLIDSIMDLTFAQRRRLIITDMARITNIIESYPVLCNSNQVSF